MKRLHFYVGKYDLIDEAEAVYKRVRVLYKGFCALIYPNPDGDRDSKALRKTQLYQYSQWVKTTSRDKGV